MWIILVLKGQNALYLKSLLRWIIATDDSADQISFLHPCQNKTDERRILSIAQDIVHSTSHGRSKMPKHIGLATTVPHLKGSQLLITLLNRMGHCSSYDEVKKLDTSIAGEVFEKSKDSGTVIPSNIHPGSFIQLAADNNDLNVETLQLWLFFKENAISINYVTTYSRCHTR